MQQEAWLQCKDIWASRSKCLGYLFVSSRFLVFVLLYIWNAWVLHFKITFKWTVWSIPAFLFGFGLILSSDQIICMFALLFEQSFKVCIVYSLAQCTVRWPCYAGSSVDVLCLVLYFHIPLLWTIKTHHPREYLHVSSLYPSASRWGGSFRNSKPKKSTFGFLSNMFNTGNNITI